MAAQDFKESVRQVAIAQAKVHEQVFLRYEYLLCSEAFRSQSYYIISQHPKGQEEKFPSGEAGRA